jgi:hypothetical protein
MRWQLPIICVLLGALTPIANAAKWSITRVNHLAVAPPNGTLAAELSGVTYLGPVAGGHRFLAAQETRGELFQFDLAISDVGAVTFASNRTAVPLSQTLDFEGIAYTDPARNSAFLSSEGDAGPVVREFDLATGAEIQTVALPAIFAAQDRAPFGLESLTRSLDAIVMWTANEQALIGDGDVSSSTTGTIVRLQELSVTGNAVASGPQYAYQVEPIHGTSTVGNPQSGLTDLVDLPDGTLIALERSVAFLGSPSAFFNRIYEVTVTGATDISVGPTASGLAGHTYTKVGKGLLWSGAADGDTAWGQNLEGLTLGPRLPNGDWVLIGVVDDGWNADGDIDGDSFSYNTVVAFTLSAIESADFDVDGDTDGADFLRWQRGVGQSLGAQFQEGDATRDGAVDNDDLEIWGAEFPALALSGLAVPEPMSLTMAVIVLTALASRPRTKAVR